ncbi:hypothetical protein ACHAPT_004082 [Fusarium lateritium]
MEQFTLENSQRYQMLVDGFKPARISPKASAEEPHPDITIATRIRPVLKDEKEAEILTGVFPRADTPGTVDLHELRKGFRGPPELASYTYHPDRVFGSDDTTETIYNDLVKPLVPWAWTGGVSTLFAYGQTGSGKTYTVSGLERLLAETLFSDEVRGARNIFISVIELAGNSAFDLLHSRKSVPILEDAFGATQLVGAEEYHVTDAATLLKHINRAALFRSVASTLKNDSSSRSHGICRIRLQNPELPPEADDGLLYLIDLAGSEAARDVAVHSAERMREAREINVSLSVLKNCIRGRAGIDAESAARGGNKYVPFRQSALTRVLKHVFDPAAGRSCKTVVVGCVNPSFLDIGASKSTFRYGEMLRVPVPKSTPKYDAATPTTWSNEHLRAWIEKNSGTPAISAHLLAPRETGNMLLRFSASKFITRCLKTPHTTMEQATAFYAKFWRLHADSHGTRRPKIQQEGYCSKDTRPEMAEVPFKERIRPGMVVNWNPPDDNTLGFNRLPGRNLVVVLAPEDEVSYRCASVVPGEGNDTFTVMLWQQVVAKVQHMEAEVLLEYDTGSRYFWETL